MAAAVPQRGRRSRAFSVAIDSIRTVSSVRPPKPRWRLPVECPPRRSLEGPPRQPVHASATRTGPMRTTGARGAIPASRTSRTTRKSWRPPARRVRARSSTFPYPAMSASVSFCYTISRLMARRCAPNTSNTLKSWRSGSDRARSAAGRFSPKLTPRAPGRHATTMCCPKTATW